MKPNLSIPLLVFLTLFDQKLEAGTAIGASTPPGHAGNLYIVSQSGSYYLTNNIIVIANNYARNGIEIIANNVTTPF